MRALVCLATMAWAACSPDVTDSSADGAVTTSQHDTTSGSDTTGTPPEDTSGSTVTTTTPTEDATSSPGDDTSVVGPADTSQPAPDVVAPGPDAEWFSNVMPWIRPVDGLDPADESQDIIDDLEAEGGWGNDNTFQIDFSIDVMEAPPGTPFEEFEPTDDWFDVECDADPMPLPVGGAVEGEDTYECAGDGDCHLIVRDGVNRKLYEMWRANVYDGVFYGGCLAIWDLDHAYDDAGRGYDCSSADAAGLPIAPLLFTADEVASGHLDHAIRFILPNPRIRHRVYVAPGTHSTNPTGGGDNAPPYGVRLRLRDDYPLETLPSDGARTVARALQKYGMFLADAGQIALTARSDRFSGRSWDGVLDPHDLADLQVTDFEVVELGPSRDYTGDCVRQ